MRLLICALFASLAWSQTITTLQTTTTFGASRPIINTNFTELNTYTMKLNAANTLTQIATPGTPPGAGYLKVYAKTGSGICWLNSSNIETCAGSGTGTGDVVGPASAVDSNFAGFNTATGKLIKDSGSKASDFAVAAKGVTNGDTHDHIGGDGAAITESTLSLTPGSTVANSAIGTHGLMPALTGSAGVVMSGAGTWIAIPGGGNVVGPAAGTGGELPTVSASGTVLSRSALTGVLKTASGVPSVVTGTATDCIRVNGTSGACSGGVSAASDLTDFKATISTTSVTNDTIEFAAGRARIGNYAPTAIALGKLIVTGGSGDIKVFIDQNNNLVCHKQTSGSITGTESGSLTCSNVATPAYPANGIPLYDLAVSVAQAVSIDADDRAFLSTRGIAAGTGIAVTDSGGVAMVAIDTATVPTLAGDDAYTGSIDATAATRTAPMKAGTAPPATCTVGDQFFDTNATAGSNLLGCTATNTWTAQAGGGGSGLPLNTAFTKSMTLFDPVTGDSGRVQVMFPAAVTITSVSCSVKAATSATINFEERAFATPDTAGTAVLTSNLVCDTNGETSTTFTNAGIAANVPLALTITGVSGTPDTLRVYVTYTID